MPPAVKRRKGTLYRVILGPGESCGESWREIAWEGSCTSGVFAGRICSRLKNVVASSFAEVESVAGIAMVVVVVVCQVDERSWRRGVAREKGCN